MFPQFDMDRDRNRDRDRDRDRNDRDGRDRDDRFRRTPFDFFRYFLPAPYRPYPQYGPQYGPPVGPPPAYIPQQPIGTYAVDPGAIYNCLFRFTYIWPYGARPFWFYPTFVGPRSVAGYRWIGYTWVYYGMDLREIRSFQCT